MRNTPWGAAQQTKKIGDKGIVSVSTASHGGIYVPSALYQTMPPALQGNAYGGGTWFEEDCEWALVACAFPQWFTPEHLGFAVATIGGFAEVGSQYHAAYLWLHTTPEGAAIQKQSVTPDYIKQRQTPELTHRHD